MKTVVDVLYEEFEELNKYFERQGELSFQVSVEGHLKKGLLLAAASYFETNIIESLNTFFAEISHSNSITTSFIKNKALNRQYHILFDWDDNKGYNKLFAYLGNHFKEYMTKNIKENKRLATSINAFMQLGAERNRLVHLNYAVYAVPKTIVEVYELYNQAMYFVFLFPDFLRLKEIDKEETKEKEA